MSLPRIALVAAIGVGTSLLWISHSHAEDYLITPAVLDRLSALPGDLKPLPPAAPAPKDNPSTPGRISLGRQLYFDTRLSGNGQVACASCHNPAMGWADGIARSNWFGTELGRHAPTTLNAAFYQTQFWDGRAESLEAQAGGPMTSAAEMHSTKAQVEGVVRTIPGYVQQFKTAYGAEPSFELVTKAIAAYERTLITPDSRFDRYLKGDKKALSIDEKRGLGLFVGKANCTACHNGPLLSDSNFHSLGVPQVGPLKDDQGRLAISGNPYERGAFKTPTLRNVALTPPYMHTGAFKTLDEVVEFYDQGGGNMPHKSMLVQKLGLNGQEKKDLVSFLQALNGRLPDSTVPQLPY